jgi:hypothetical protein
MSRRRSSNHRTGLSDTDPEADLVLIELARRAPAHKKLAQVFSTNRTVRALAVAERDRTEVNLPAADEGQVRALLSVIELFEKLGISYLIGGSFASSLYGVARSTADADLLATVKRGHAGQIASELEEEYYVSEPAIIRAADTKRSFNLIHLETAFKIDVFVAKEDGFAQSQLSRRRLVSLTPEAQVYFASVEDTVLAKLDWYKRGEEVSDQQWRDVVTVLKVQKGRLEVDYMKRWAEELRIGDLLEEAMREAGTTE